jgi:hypothetical protein
MDQKTIDEIKKAQSAKEVAEMARKEGISLGDGQAEALYKQYHSDEGELSDSELNNVSGGCQSAADLRKEGKYMEVVPTSACYAFEWSYGIFCKDGQKMECGNCHHAFSAADGAKTHMTAEGLECGTSLICDYHLLK